MAPKKSSRVLLVTNYAFAALRYPEIPLFYFFALWSEKAL